MMVANTRSGRLMRKRKLRPIAEEHNAVRLAELYAGAADEDRRLAEAGMADYARMLDASDKDEEGA